jgi:hypothetical protein
MLVAWGVNAGGDRGPRSRDRPRCPVLNAVAQPEIPGAGENEDQCQRVNEVPAWALIDEPGWGSAIVRVAVFA